jgi:uncharacterized protein YdiU (UPF0061 family)
MCFGIMRLAFDNTYAALPQHFYAPVSLSPVAEARIIRVNRPLAEQLGVDPAWLASPEGAEVVAGNRLPEGATPIATAYAGHQFGSLNPQLGDGRALLLGEIVTPQGERFDLQLKGSGRTPFSRNGDGRSPLGPVLREYIVSEAMTALGVPSTRALAAASSGQPVMRERPLPGGVLLRVAHSHIRVGTFEFFGCRDDAAALNALVAHTLSRHYPTVTIREGGKAALELLRGVGQRQAELVAQWQLIGFIHGVMNTDNMLVSGETIDFGPCAFMDTFDPATVFSSIDRRGRYAYSNQPGIAQWNIACLARALLPIIGTDDAASVAEAQAIIDAFPAQHAQRCREGWARKLGLSSTEDGDSQLLEDLLHLMHEAQLDFTLSFRHLYDLVSAQAKAASDEPVAPLLTHSEALAPWLARWTERLARDPMDQQARAHSMRLANPALIARNHQVEAAIRDAEDNNDFGRFHRLVDTLADPYSHTPDNTWLARSPELHERVLQTFCGT